VPLKICQSSASARACIVADVSLATSERLASRDYYKSPEDITQDSELSPDEKRQALNTWEQDARQMMTASNEGMEGDDDPLREIRREPAQTTWPAPLQSRDGWPNMRQEPKPATRATSCSPVREYRGSIPDGAGPAGQPSHIFHRRCACPAPPPPMGRWEAVVHGTR
jgi:hypothetical protein